MLALKNIGTYCLQSCENIASNFEGFSGIATVWVWWKCNKYITFSRGSCHAGIGFLKFWSNEVLFKPKRFSSLGISLINLIEKHILFHPKTKGVAIYIYRCLDTINPKYIDDISTTDDVIKWKHFPRYWPFVEGIHRSPVTRSFDVFFDLRLNQQLSKHWKCRWFETPPRSLWCHCEWNSEDVD